MVAKAVKNALPNLDVVPASDKEHLPYGTKTPQEILGYVVPILQNLVAQGCKVIVIACNTVTTTLIEQLREQISVPLVGIEPMIKPAAELTKTGTIAVCATPTTLSSKRYKFLKEEYAVGVTVLEPDCSDWTDMIEANRIDRKNIHERINDVCTKGADVIVLGCTHYHWIEEIIKEVAAGRAKILQPEQPVIQQLKEVLNRLT